MEKTVEKTVLLVKPPRRKPGRPKGSKNKVVRAMRTIKRVKAETAELNKDSLVAALGLLLVAVDILKKTIN